MSSFYQSNYGQSTIKDLYLQCLLIGQIQPNNSTFAFQLILLTKWQTFFLKHRVIIKIVLQNKENTDR